MKRNHNQILRYVFIKSTNTCCHTSGTSRPEGRKGRHSGAQCLHGTFQGEEHSYDVFKINLTAALGSQSNRILAFSSQGDQGTPGSDGVFVRNFFLIIIIIIIINNHHHHHHNIFFYYLQVLHFGNRDFLCLFTLIQFEIFSCAQILPGASREPRMAR